MKKPKFPKTLAQFNVKMEFRFTPEQLSVLRQQINLFFLGDKNGNMHNENGDIVPKYPEKETNYFKLLGHRINHSFQIEVPAHFQSNGDIIFSNGDIIFGDIKKMELLTQQEKEA